MLARNMPRLIWIFISLFLQLQFMIVFLTLKKNEEKKKEASVFTLLRKQGIDGLYIYSFIYGIFVVVFNVFFYKKYFYILKHRDLKT